MKQTLPGFEHHKIRGSLSETRLQRQARMDRAASATSKRVDIDHWLDAKRLDAMLREMEL